jgi:hypothetical protein
VFLTFVAKIQNMPCCYHSTVILLKKEEEEKEVEVSLLGGEKSHI